MFEYVGKSDSGRQAVENDFENAANHIAFNHNDERIVVLVGNVAKRDGGSDDLLFSASDSYKWAFISEFDERSKLPVD